MCYLGQNDQAFVHVNLTNLALPPLKIFVLRDWGGGEVGAFSQLGTGKNFDLVFMKPVDLPIK